MPVFPKDPVNYQIQNQVLQKVERVIAAYEMFGPHDKVLVGVSGGPDSVALLHVLLQLTPHYDLKLGIAHLNHGLRGKEADADAAFVATLAQRFELPVYIQKRDIHQYRIDEKLSLEEAARQIRYAFYHEVAEKNEFNKIALGHQANDNAEHVLMYLFRGSGTLGLSGIPPVRSGRIVRPLIRVTRSEIENYLAAAGLDYVIDRSNIDPKFIRNKIRHQLLPLLTSSYNPKLIETLNRLADIMRSEEQWIKDTIQRMFKDALVSSEPEALALSVPALNRNQRAARRRLIRMAVRTVKGDLRRINFGHVESSLMLLEKGKTYVHLDLPGSISVRRSGDVLFVTREKSNRRHLHLKDDGSEVCSFNYVIPEPGFQPATVCVKEAGVQLEFSKTRVENIPDIRKTGQQVAFFDMNRLVFPLTLRNFQPGDRFRPLGMVGTQKVKDFFINHKIPRSYRRRCPILLSRDDIIWIVGYRIGDSVKVTEATADILKGVLLLAE